MAIPIVVWDNIGNVLLGLRPWADWDAKAQAQFLAEDPDAQTKIVSFDAIFKEYPVALHQVQTIEALTECIDKVEILIVHKETLPAELLSQATNLRFIQHLGLDHRGVPVGAARARNIPVAATPLINYLAVAEHSWALILNHLKRLPAQRAHVKTRAYLDYWGRFPGLKLVRDQTLGLLGFGEIARPLADMAVASGMSTFYWDIKRFPELEERYGVSFLPWQELFETADVLSVHLALNEQTQGIIGAKELSLMKSTSLFVNTSRGKLVDEAALIKALQRGQIGGAALDVFAEEPLATNSPLHDLHEADGFRVTLTPHTAWQSPWTWVRDSQALWFNLLKFLEGKPLDYLV
jgi:phosphoglycerate dehydrogenase-like enzyme